MVSTHQSGTPRGQAGRKPSLNLPLDKVSFIILKAREFDAKEGDVDPDEGSNAIDDGQTDILTDKEDDPVREELLGAIRSLNDDEPGWGAAPTARRNGAKRSPPRAANIPGAPRNTCLPCRCWATIWRMDWRSSTKGSWMTPIPAKD